MKQEPGCSLLISFSLSQLKPHLGFSFALSPWASAPRCPTEDARHASCHHLHYLYGKHGVLLCVRQRYGLYKASVSFILVFRDLIFKLSFSPWISLWNNMKVPEYSCFSSFPFQPINGQATATVFQILKKKSVTLFRVSCHSYAKSPFFSAFTCIKLNVKANNRILIGTYLFTLL